MADPKLDTKQPKAEEKPQKPTGTGIFTRPIPKDFAEAATKFENSKGGKKKP